MIKQTKQDLFNLGMQDKVLSYFTMHGPYNLSNEAGEIFYADFIDEDAGITSTCVSTMAQFSDAEMQHLGHRLRDEAKIYHIRGKQAGEDLITFLTNSLLFERHIRGMWWFRGYYRTKSIFQKAFALLAFWRYTWVTKMFVPNDP